MTTSSSSVMKIDFTCFPDIDWYIAKLS